MRTAIIKTTRKDIQQNQKTTTNITYIQNSMLHFFEKKINNRFKIESNEPKLSKLIGNLLKKKCDQQCNETRKQVHKKGKNGMVKN